jgi:hypothetical protein
MHKPIQIICTQEKIIALREDGSMWEKPLESFVTWWNEILSPHKQTDDEVKRETEALERLSRAVGKAAFGGK